MALLLAACGISHGPTPADGETHQARAPASGRCPLPQPARSSGAAPTTLARGHEAWTRFCLYGAKRRVFAQARYRGGPLDLALNGSVENLPSDTACSAVARAPAVVVLTSRTSTRYVVLETGGCPAVVLSSGARRYLDGAGADAVLRFYVRVAARR